MRKRIIEQSSKELSPPEQGWLDLEHLAEIEISSEDAAHPIESAIIPGTGPGWRAISPGEQTVRLLFTEPLRIRRIRLEFEEKSQVRTQEFVLRWSMDGQQNHQEIVRQQFSFSPPNTTHEVEDYKVDLNGVTALELKIVPDISGSAVCASLKQLQLA